MLWGGRSMCLTGHMLIGTPRGICKLLQRQKWGPCSVILLKKINPLCQTHRDKLLLFASLMTLAECTHITHTKHTQTTHTGIPMHITHTTHTHIHKHTHSEACTHMHIHSHTIHAHTLRVLLGWSRNTKGKAVSLITPPLLEKILNYDIVTWGLADRLLRFSSTWHKARVLFSLLSFEFWNADSRLFHQWTNVSKPQLSCRVTRRGRRLPVLCALRQWNSEPYGGHRSHLSKILKESGGFSFMHFQPHSFLRDCLKPVWHFTSYIPSVLVFSEEHGKISPPFSSPFAKTKDNNYNNPQVSEAEPIKSNILCLL